jgi:hypothetical protein
MEDEELTKEERDEELTEEERLEQEREDARDHGKCVYSLSSDQGWVSSWASIYLWKGRYWVYSDYGVDGGPFATLEEALSASGLYDFGEGCSVYCRVLTEARLLPLLKVHGDYFILNEHCRIRKMVKGTERWVLGEPQEW